MDVGTHTHTHTHTQIHPHHLPPAHGRALNRSHHFQVQMGLIRMLILVLNPPAARRASNVSMKMPTSPFVALDSESEAQTVKRGLGSGYQGLSIYRKSNALGLEPKTGPRTCCSRRNSAFVRSLVLGCASVRVHVRACGCGCASV